jgi:hypothetical protein
MRIIIRKRAEIALRSLDKPDRDRANRALGTLQNSELREILRTGKITRLNTISSENLYSYRAGLRLRLVLSRTDGEWILEDVVDHDRLLRILPKGGGNEKID